jgi:hypothetical protein
MKEDKKRKPLTGEQIKEMVKYVIERGWFNGWTKEELKHWANTGEFPKRGKNNI